MEYRIKDYTIKGQRILLPRQTSIEDLRLIFNETQKKLICSTATKDNVSLTQGEGGTLVEVPTSVCSINSTDLLTIKCDYGDNLEEVKDAVETQLPALADKIDNIKLPEIDTTEFAKQGDDKNATLTAIYKMLVGNDEPSQDIPEGVAERLALILEFFGIKSIQAYEFMTPEEVCSTLEDIMTSMDLELTPEKAAEITSNTLNN